MQDLQLCAVDCESGIARWISSAKYLTVTRILRVVLLVVNIYGKSCERQRRNTTRSRCGGVVLQGDLGSNQ